MKNKRYFKEMSNRNKNVWKLAFIASFQSGETKRQNNRFILNRDITELKADCGAKEISLHLLTAPKNAKYFSSSLLTVIRKHAK